MKTILLMAVVLAALSGCNTIAGIGDDISGGARAVQSWI